MSGPITNYELDMMLHHKYEAEASRYWGQYWGQEVTSEEKSGSAKALKLELAFIGVTLMVLLLVQLLSL